MAAVKRDVQALVLLTMGVVIWRITWSDLFLNYVKEPMRPLLLVSAGLLVVLGLWSLAIALRQPAEAHSDSGHSHGHDHTRAPKVAWLILLPVAAMFIITPPPLGSDAAARDSGTQPLSQNSDGGYEPLPETDGPITLNLDDYAARALFDGGQSMADREISLTGFVTENESGGWYLTRFVSSCCAADASAVKVEIQDAPSPPEEQWVTVTGVYTDNGSTDYQKPPAFAAQDVIAIEPPRDTYL